MSERYIPPSEMGIGKEKEPTRGAQDPKFIKTLKGAGRVLSMLATLGGAAGAEAKPRTTEPALPPATAQKLEAEETERRFTEELEERANEAARKRAQLSGIARPRPPREIKYQPEPPPGPRVMPEIPELLESPPPPPPPRRIETKPKPPLSPGVKFEIPERLEPPPPPPPPKSGKK